MSGRPHSVGWRGGAVVATAAILHGCVTERPSSRPPGLTKGPRVQMPAGPVADPVVDATTNSSVTVAVMPLGTVAYDGQALPLLSPDGRFLAVEQGEPPDWGAVLALPGARPVRGTTLAIYDLSGTGPSRVPMPQPLEPGLILGRAADNQGFLVESPRPDGSRWIGRVSWATGQLAWLLHDDQVHAHATLTPEGALLCAAAPPGGGRAGLLLAVPGGGRATAELPDASLMFPTASADPHLVYAIAASTAGLELVAFEARQEPGRAALGALRARRLLTSATDPGLAYQATIGAGPAAPVAPAPSTPAGTAPPDNRLLLFHPRLGRMAIFDPASSGFLLLPARSVAAARSPFPGDSGYFVTTPTGLAFAPDSTLTAAGARERTRIPGASVLADPFVPRLTTSVERPLILFGPAPRDPGSLQLVALRPPGAAAP